MGEIKEQGVRSDARAAAPLERPSRVSEHTREPAEVAFTSAMADYFQRVSPTMDRDYAQLLAVGSLAEFLKDEGIEFGADGYDWGAEAAAIIGEEYETRHWEAA